MPTEAFSVLTKAGHTLSGSLEMPTGLLRGAAVFAHCFTCTKQSKAAVSVARALASEGIACLRFDFTGLGGSQGEFGRAGFSSDVDDLVATVGALADRFNTKLLLIGHSLGGAAVLAAAHQLGKDKVAAIATIGAPSDVPHVLHNIKGDQGAIRRDGSGTVSIGGREFLLGREFLEQTEAVNLLELLGGLRIPYLCLHSPTDQIVGIEHATALFGTAFHPKNFVSLAGADHLLTDARDAGFAAKTIAAWADRYLPETENPINTEVGVLSQTGYGKFGTEVHAGTHHFIADEPLNYGGDNSGPTPYDLLGAALGTCTVMTMKMYADRKKLPLDMARVHVTHERKHSVDCEECETGETVQALHREIELVGPELTEADRDRIIAIADKCPVHRTLEGKLHIVTRSKA